MSLSEDDVLKTRELFFTFFVIVLHLCTSNLHLGSQYLKLRAIEKAATDEVLSFIRDTVKKYLRYCTNNFHQKKYLIKFK